MLESFIHKLINTPDSYLPQDTGDATRAILSGKCTDAQIGAFLTALTLYGPDQDHLHEAAQALMEQAITVPGHEQTAFGLLRNRWGWPAHAKHLNRCVFLSCRMWRHHGQAWKPLRQLTMRCG